MVAYLLQPRVMEGVFSTAAPLPATVTVGIDMDGPFVEGDTLTGTVVRRGPLVGDCSVAVELSGVPEGWLVDSARQVVSLATGQTSVAVAWRTVVVVGDQGTNSVTARLVDPVGCEIDVGAASSVFEITDATQPSEPPTLSVARHASTPTTIDEGQTARFVVTSSYRGLSDPATFDYAATTGVAADLTAPVSGNDVPIAGDTDTVEIAAVTANRSGSQGNRTLTATISGAVGATIVTATASVVIRDVAPVVELPTPIRSIDATPATVRGILAGTSSYGPIVAGDHIILATGTYNRSNVGGPISFGRSGSGSDPIVIRSRSKLGANWRVPMGIKGDNVYLWGIDLTDCLTAYPDAMGVTISANLACGIAFEGINCRLLRSRISFTKMVDSDRLGRDNDMHGVHVSEKSSGFKALRNEFVYSAAPNVAWIPANPSESSANGIRPLLLMLKPGGGANNRNAEVAYNLFKGWPGGEYWDPIKGQGWGRSQGYDKLVRGTVLSIGGWSNPNFNTPCSGITIHHNLILNTGIATDFGGVRANGQHLCDVSYNTCENADGIRLRMSQNWNIVANWIGSNTRGLYGCYGPGHVWIGNRSAVPLSARAGDTTGEALNPWPPNAGGPKPASSDCVFYGNRGDLYIGWDEFNAGLTVPCRNVKVYGHRSLEGTLQTGFGDVIVDKGGQQNTQFFNSVPANITVPTAVRLTESDVGPNS